MKAHPHCKTAAVHNANTLFDFLLEVEGMLQGLSPLSSEILTEKEVADILRIAPSSVRNARARGQLPFIRIGINRGRVLYRKDDVEQFINRNRQVEVKEAALKRKPPP
jgi:hypothetical protein